MRSRSSAGRLDSDGPIRSLMDPHFGRHTPMIVSVKTDLVQPYLAGEVASWCELPLAPIENIGYNRYSVTVFLGRFLTSGSPDRLLREPGLGQFERAVRWLV